MRLMGFLLIFIWSFSCLASTDEEVLNALLVDLKKGKPGAIKKIELLYSKTTDKSVSLGASFILASSPADQLSLHPSFYAQYHLLNSRSLEPENKVYLARIAGDGFFEKGQFPLATKWYNYGLKTPELSKDQREYFTYKVAWSDLNQNRPERAFELLFSWLSERSDSLIREPMIIDMGRSFAESKFGKSKSQLLIPAMDQFSEGEKIHFIHGVFAGFKRSKKKINDLVRAFEGTPLRKLAFQELLQNRILTTQHACAVIPLVNDRNFEVWKSLPFKSQLIDCIRILEKNKKSAHQNKAVAARFLKRFNDLSYEETLLLGSINKQAKEKRESCHAFVRASRIVDDNPGSKGRSFWEDWLSRSSEVCLDGEANEAFADRVFELRPVWYELGFEGYLLSSKFLPMSYKGLLLDWWIKTYGWSKKNILNVQYVPNSLWTKGRLRPFAKAAIEEGSSEVIESLLTVVDSEGYWTQILPMSQRLWSAVQGKRNYLSQYLAAAVDQSFDSLEKNSFEIIPDKKMRQSLIQLCQSSNVSDLPSSLKDIPIGQEFRQLILVRNFSPSGKGGDITKENLILKIQTFLNLARNLQAISWSSQVLESKSKEVLLMKAEIIRNQISQQSGEKESHSHWALIDKEMNKWVQRLK